MKTLILKTIRDHRRSTFSWTIGLIALISVQLSVYPTIKRSAAGISQFLDQYPETLKVMFRMQDYTTGPGFLGTELFSLMVPIIFIAIGAAGGANASAEEEERGTADILLTLPISRVRILISKVLATTLTLFVVTIMGFFNIYLGANFVSMEISPEKIIAPFISCFFIGLFFTAVGSLAGVLTGKKGISLGVSIAGAITTFLFFSLAPLVSTFDFLAPINPFQWALGGNPVFNGVDYAGSLKLLAGTLLLSGISLWRYHRKDIHG